MSDEEGDLHDEEGNVIPRPANTLPNRCPECKTVASVVYI